MKDSGRINRRAPAGFTRTARNRGIDADHFCLLLAPFFAIPWTFLFWRNGEISARPVLETWVRPELEQMKNMQAKTMKTLHSLIAGLRPASLILARRIALPLLLLGAGLVLIQPCAGQSGTWAATGSLITPRSRHTATLLPNGKVLVAGGDNYGPPASAELYDPATGTWTATGSLATARSYHTATLLPNGKVLVAGGYGGNYPPGALASAELYDPATETWTATGSLTNGRYYHTATLLPNGKVLVAGGSDAENLASAELYDPATGTWTATGNLGTVRFLHKATLLSNGKVLVAGGGNYDSPLASAELYDPTTGTWSATGSLTTGRTFHTATLLPNGQVLVTGGLNVGYVGSEELYDPATGTWSAAGSLATARDNHTATLLPNGKVLIAGGGFSGTSLTSAELYDPATGTWAATGSLNTGRVIHTATLLPDGKVLVAGGADEGTGLPFASAELYLGPPTPPALLNISTRMRVLTGDQVLIGGFIITGTELKRVLIRGIGPSLNGVGVTLSDPSLELHQGNTTLTTNDNWKTRPNGTSQQADIEATTIPPTNDSESAILTMLSPGAYTAILADKNGGIGVGLVEVYDLGQGANSTPANISTRGFVDTGDNVMIGGLIVGGGSGGNTTVIVRAIGPSLGTHGVTGALADPTLELHDLDGLTIASNDNWRSDQEAEIIATTIPPTDDLESAIVETFAPGNYTAIVRGVNGTTGVALVEAYGLQ